jgi:hypothetical protein
MAVSFHRSPVIGNFCMLAHYLWQSKHWPSTVYHAHLLASKTASPAS